MSNIVNYLVNLGFSIFATGILKYGAQFNEDSQPILIELADISVALKGGDRRKRRKLEKEKEDLDTDAYPPPLLLLLLYYFLYMHFTQRQSQSITSTNMLRAVRF
jgi:hypothetical protein